MLRLDDTKKAIADYLIMPAANLNRPYLHFSRQSGHGAVRVETEADLVAAIKRQF